MGLFDSVSDAVGGISDMFSGGGGGGWGDWISTGADFLWNNMDDILDFGGTAWEQYQRVEQQEDVENIANKQAKELQNVADANAALLRYDSEVAEENALRARARGDVAFLRNKENVDAILGAQTARYAKAGVAPGEGTPVDVAMETAYKGALEGIMIKNNARVQSEQFKDLAVKKEAAAEETLRRAAAQINILEDATKDKLSALEYQQWMSGLNKLMEIGEQQSWWV